MELLPILPRRAFLMPEDRTSSCCNARAVESLTTEWGKAAACCSVCGKQLNYIGHNSKQAHSFTDLDQLYVTDNQYGKRVRQVKYTSRYFISRQHGKIIRIQSKNIISYDWAKGMLYRVNIPRPGKKIVRNITYVGAHQVKAEFIKKAVQMRAFYLLPEIDIIRDMEQMFGVNDIYEFIDRCYNDTNLYNSQVNLIMYCLAYPKFTWMANPICEPPTPKFRNALKNGKNRKDLFDAYFNGNVGKSTIHFLNDPLLGHSPGAWWAVRFLSHFLNKDKLWNFINSGRIVYLITEDDSFYYEESREMMTHKNISEFVREYGIDRFLNHVESSVMDMADATTYDGQNVKRYEMAVARAKGFIKDSITMWRKLKDELPDWEMSRYSGIKDCHDKLMRDTKKIQQQNQEIEYTPKEQNLNCSYANIEFILPHDTHTIIDLGDMLDICVGGAGYTQRAVRKENIIMFGMIDSDPVVCMEIVNKNLIQAKMFQNAQAKKDHLICAAIERLCDDNKISYSRCHDIVNVAQKTLGGEPIQDLHGMWEDMVEEAGEINF